MATSAASAPTLPSTTSTGATSQPPVITSQPPPATISSSSDFPSSITQILAELKHEKKNQNLQRLPPSHSITRRPIIHAPIASPFAGPGAQKVVYVSSKTPLMSAVKRVRKFLQQMEKRAMHDVKLVERGEREGMRKLVEARERLQKQKEKEEVLVKASGRAMGKAVAVGRWFEEKEREWRLVVEVRSGSVSVVDDIVEVEEEDDEGDGSDGDEDDGKVVVDAPVEETRLEGGDTTMGLLGVTEKKSNFETDENDLQENEQAEQAINKWSDPSGLAESGVPAAAKTKKRGRRRKKRKAYEAEDVPEQRLRWVKTVEVAITLKA